MHTSMMMTVNSPPVPHRDITGASTASYQTYNDDYTSVQRRQDRHEVEAERTKKDKKWSIGKLFRRKKKDDESGSSSQSDDDISGRSPKRKAKKKKKAPPINNFDHIVIRDSRRAQSLAKPTLRDTNDDGVLSDPSAGFINYRAKTQNLYGLSKESLSLKDDHVIKKGRIGNETPSRKTRKGRLKARVEALRNSMRGESSSDEESLKSSNSSSMIRFRSEDSLMRSRDSSLNKKSRSARNERYIKRLSRDEENQLNKEAELLQQGYTKAEIEMLTRTPTSQSSGYGTCKRETCNKTVPEPTAIHETNILPLKSESVSSFPSTQSYPSSINFNAKVNNEHINYSIKYPNINNVRDSHLYANNDRQRTASSNYDNSETVMCVKFPLGNVTNVKKPERKNPPVPPPRDMHRKVTTPLSMYYENNPIAADRAGTNQVVTHGVPNNDFERIMRRSQERSLSYGLNGLRRPLSNSEDHIAMQNNENLQNIYYRKEQPRRPASVSAEPNHYGHYINTPPWRKKIEQPNIIKPEPLQLRNDYLYYADQSPRSRRPISIKNGQNVTENQYLSDSQTSTNIPNNIHRRPRNASEFWKKIDDAERQRQQQTSFANSRNSSEYSSNSQLHRNLTDQNKIMGRNTYKTENTDIQNKNKTIDTSEGANVWKATTEYKRSITVEPQIPVSSPTCKTHVRHKSDTFVANSFQVPSDDEKSSERRKSTNLDDALNELEAIYNSLGLGDEDLLDRAERRELMTPKFNDHFNDWNGNDNEIQLRSQPTTPLRRISRRSTLPDKLQDDMAFRRMNSFSSKDKPNYKDSQAQISYMLASPVYIPYASDDDRHSERNEPDIVYDDVVYRNIKQTNNRLKVVDPQPPFGIPVGPVSPAPQSDYLHATPENKGRSRFVPKRSPDIVSDDLAYRSLRKDNKHTSLFNNEETTIQMNNNHNYHDLLHCKDSTENIKKKRAIRSLSANIFTMIQKEIDEALNMTKAPALQKTHSNSDVMRRLRETYENKDTKQEFYPRNKVKQRNNTVNVFVNNPHNITHHFAKDDSFINCDDKYYAKPSSSCDKSKSSSPSHKSPQSSKRSSKDEFQQVLSMLAQEAMDTSNKLGVALAELDKNRNNNDKVSDVQNRLSESRLSFLNELTNKSNDNVNTEESHNKAFQCDYTEQNFDNKDNKSKAERTEDSLFTLSDQIHKVEDQLKYSFEKDFKFNDESMKLSDYVNSQPEELKAEESFVIKQDIKIAPDVVPIAVQNDATNIENLGENDKKSQISTHPQINSLNPFLNPSDKMKELDEIKAFKELKDGISDLIAGISEVNEKLFQTKTTKNESGRTNDNAEISETNQRLNKVRDNGDNVGIPKSSSPNFSIYEDDFDLKKDAADSTEYNSSEELATIFKLNNNNKTTHSFPEINKETDNKPRDDLNSPKLVKSINQHLRRMSIDEGDSSQTNSLPSDVVPWRHKNQCNSSEKEKRASNNTQSKRNWHDSGTLMLACSYTLMLSQHLTDMDWLTLLGLLLAMITIIAMLLI
ncbi:putative leucine-rich repeat-containing protein DDB_G0290503 isoform X2 [Battus philenor]|uniref:putative leucine-rich repeat-containing protein DDB_G0290503 isoform X2 n=1 Tax=Battus philenor TaxID=42288 RepID=UPI0035CFAF73